MIDIVDRPEARSPEPEALDHHQIRTVVVAPSWVGDTVMALPTIEAVAVADRRVSVLAKPHLEPLLELSPAVAEVIPRGETGGESVERLRAAELHEAIVLPNSFRSAWLTFRAGIPYRWGYRGDFRSPLLTAPVSRPDRDRHQTADYRELLEAMEIATPASWTPRISLREELVERGRERLDRAGIAPGGDGRREPLVGLFAGAEYGPSKRWPWRRFTELSTAVRRAVPRSRQVILAGPSEVWLAVRIREESGKIHPVVGPDLDLAGLAAVMTDLDLLVTNDSGPMHLAAALGIPCVALFGPTDPGRTAPAGDAHAVLYTDRWCSPCFRRRCPLLHHRCLRDISVEDVAAAATRLLG